MKPAIARLFSIVLFSIISICSYSQLIEEAHKCYTYRDYSCAVTKYTEALRKNEYKPQELPTINYRLGASYGKLGKNREALAYLKKAVELKPTWGLASWELAVCYYNLDSFFVAERHYGNAIQQYSSDRATLKLLHYGKGMANFRMRYYGLAAAEFKKSFEIDSTQQNVAAALGDASFNIGSYADAARYYAKSIKLVEGTDFSKDQVAVRYFWLGQALMRSSNPADALKAFEEAKANGYDEGKVQNALAGANYDLEKYREAIDHYTKGISLLSKDSSILKNMYYFRARSYEELKDYNKALADYHTSTLVDKFLTEAYIAQGKLLRELKRYKDAIVVYDNGIKVTSISSSLSKMHYERGMTYLALKDTLHAKSDFIFAVEYNANLAEANIELGHFAYQKKDNYSTRRLYGYLGPELKYDNAVFSELYFRKGFASFRLGQTYYKDAKEDFLKSLEYDSLNKYSRRYMGDIYFIEKNYDKAEAEITRCINLFKNEKDSLVAMYRHRGVIRSYQNRWRETLQDYEAADKLSPMKDPADLASLGKVAYEVKEFNKASGYFTRMIQACKPEQKQNLLEAYYYRGRVNIELKDKTKALQDLNKALEYSPGNDEVRKWIATANALP